MRRLGAISTGALLLGVLAAASFAQAPQIGQVKSVAGEAVAVRGGARVPLKVGDPVFQHDTVETGAAGSLGITFNDNSVFSTGPGSQLSLDDFRFDPDKTGNGMLASLRKGTLTVVSGGITHTDPGSMKIKTPTATLGVRGTTFAVEVR
jgi:hypothetical protein